ncbi:MAG: glycosyltransferase [archaeon]|nr:glycosyltransferase [archaeon]
MSDLEITVGVCAYNEAKIIETAIRSVYSQVLEGIVIKEVLVVSSGSTDGTDEIVIGLSKEFPSLRLYRQEKKEGKNSAINCYLDNKVCDLVVMLNADNAFGTNDSLQKLVEPFRDPKVGITGGHPVPTNDTSDIVGFAVNMMWSMHHHLALEHPKLGEIIAFRDIGTRLPLDKQSDEDIIRMEIEKAGYTCIYVGDCIIRNRGPETFSDFQEQRVRVNAGECRMKKDFDYNIPTWNKKYLIRAMLACTRDLGFHPIKMIRVARWEIKFRKMAQEYVDSGKPDLNNWIRVESTKKL